MSIRVTRPLFSLILLLTCIPTIASAQVAESDRRLVDRVASRILTVGEANPAFLWPPNIEIQNSTAINAFATATRTADGAKLQPRVIIFSGMLSKVIQGKPDRLAFVLGHEIAHISLGHIIARPERDKTAFLGATFTREEEIAADKKGMELAVAAGYSVRESSKGIQRMVDLGLEYSSFEGLRQDHPSWKDRLALLDVEQKSLWKSMSAFHNGTFFMGVEQYATAEQCFAQVTADFPSCQEAWADLGHARLMQYCDALTEADLREFGIGLPCSQAFQIRPESLEVQVRGVNKELWQSAVQALQEAIRLSPKLPTAQADLGLAMLVSPDGSEARQALEYLKKAADLGSSDSTTDPMVRGAIYVNAAVASIASGYVTRANTYLDAARKCVQENAAHRSQSSSSQELSSAIQYNDALLLWRTGNKQNRRKAAAELQKYLNSSSSTSAWWNLAYAQYADLCDEQKLKAIAKDDLRSSQQPQFRLVTSISLDTKTTITLSDSIEKVVSILGRGQTVPVVPDTELARIRYGDRGIELLVDDRVLAIFLNDKNSPPVTIQHAGLSTEKRELRVGMSLETLKQIVSGSASIQKDIDNPGKHYIFCLQLGLAYLAVENVVTELVIVQDPRHRP